MTRCRVVLFGDPQGVPQLLRCLGANAAVLAIVQASGRPTQQKDMKVLAAHAGVPLLIQPSTKSTDYGAFVHAVGALRPDLILINSYSMILRPDLLALPARGAVNVHGALLPQYRGANVTEWALINEERESGVTVHVVDAGIDTGPIVGQKMIPLTFEDTWIDVRQRINRATDELLAERMASLLTGDFSATAQRSGEGRQWPRRAEKDGQFEWHYPLRRIYNLVRALVAPHPGAWCQGTGKTSVIFDRWLSLPDLAVQKARVTGGWLYEGLALSPREPEPTIERAAANATFHFDVRTDNNATRGEAVLDKIDYFGGSARAVINKCERIESRVFDALMRFAREELKVLRLEPVLC